MLELVDPDMDGTVYEIALCHSKYVVCDIRTDGIVLIIYFMAIIELLCLLRPNSLPLAPLSGLHRIWLIGGAFTHTSYDFYYYYY